MRYSSNRSAASGVCVFRNDFSPQFLKVIHFLPNSKTYRDQIVVKNQCYVCRVTIVTQVNNKYTDEIFIGVGTINLIFIDITKLSNWYSLQAYYILYVVNKIN